MNDAEFRDICLLLAVLGLTVSGEQVEHVANHAHAITNDLMSLRTGDAVEAGIVAIRKRRTK